MTLILKFDEKLDLDLEAVFFDDFLSYIVFFINLQKYQIGL